MAILTVKDERMYAIVNNYDMQTTFFKSVLEGITDNDAHNRFNTKANHVAWLAGSLVQQRFDTANLLGKHAALKQEGYELFKDNQGLKDGIAYPALEQYKQDWDKVTPILREHLLAADAEEIDSIIEFPGMTMTLFEFFAFVIYREANHIGQMALWRRLLGYEPMKYM